MDTCKHKIGPSIALLCYACEQGKAKLHRFIKVYLETQTKRKKKKKLTFFKLKAKPNTP